MKKLITLTIALSTLLWIGCGDDDDDDGGGGGGNTITVTADTMIAPAMPLVYNDAAWDDVSATSIALATGNALQVGPVKTPLGPDKALAAPSSVELQAIKKGGRLYLRFQWDDASLSMQRENWILTDAEFNFLHQTFLGEDQIVVLFEGDPDSAWDMWNWRVLTTGFLNKAEDGSMLDSVVEWDAGLNQVAWENAPADNFSPTHFPASKEDFTGDILYKSERISRAQAQEGGTGGWEIGLTIPGWYIDDLVDFATVTESRWDIDAVHNYDSNTDQYTMVMVRDMNAHDDDVDMSELTRIKTRLGVIDNDKGFDTGSSQRKFSEDFWLALP